MKSEQTFIINATSDINVEEIMQKLQTIVAKKMEEGAYRDINVAEAEFANLESLRTHEEFLDFYLECLKDSIYVQIGDFEIHEKRKYFTWFFVLIKKIIWKLLKFYTYRLWSQQNQINGHLLAAITSVDNKYNVRFNKLEEEIAQLKNALSGKVDLSKDN